ncbi:MAG: farnesyl-diphosphate farnesyltransferase, partial [Planctomycetota bacterium]
MSAPDSAVLDALLRGTSRSFYLSLRLLPRSSAGALGLSYLLARASDTIADTEVCPAERRLEHLVRFAEALSAAERPGGEPEAERLCAPIAGDLTGLADNESERRLLARLPELVRAFAQLEPARRTSAGRCLATIIAGQRFDLE